MTKVCQSIGQVAKLTVDPHLAGVVVEPEDRSRFKTDLALRSRRAQRRRKDVATPSGPAGPTALRAVKGILELRTRALSDSEAFVFSFQYALERRPKAAKGRRLARHARDLAPRSRRSLRETDILRSLPSQPLRRKHELISRCCAGGSQAQDVDGDPSARHVFSGWRVGGKRREQPEHTHDK